MDSTTNVSQANTLHPILAETSLGTAFQRLDLRLEAAIAAQQNTFGPAANDSFRGLFISSEDVRLLLERPPGRAAFAPPEAGTLPPLTAPLEQASPLAWLRDTFQLDPFDLDLLLIGFAPEFDRRYERLYAYLQDDVSRRRPEVDLALNLLCATSQEKIDRRAHFEPGSPLRRHHLIHLIPDPHQPHPSLLAHFYTLDEQVVRLLLQRPGLDSRIQPYALLLPPDPSLSGLSFSRREHGAAAALFRQADPYSGLILHLCGPQGTGKRLAAQIIASTRGQPLLRIDLRAALEGNPNPGALLRLAVREAVFQGAILLLEGVPRRGAESEATAFARLAEVLAESRPLAILTGTEPWEADGEVTLEVISIPFPQPDFAQRRLAWQAAVQAAGMKVEESTLEALASRFRLNSLQIASAVFAARGQARLRAAGEAEHEVSAAAAAAADLFAAARAQTAGKLAGLAKKIEPSYAWEDIVLPADSLAQLQEICQRVMHSHQVLGGWGFAQKLSLGKGVSALFSGPSGTGKTMAAEIIAHTLELDLYKIDLSGIVSKYIGETEKNLNRIFEAAENANAILFFDEADALFGKRSEVRDSHDRYANIEIAYLLQKMEEYPGVTILTTNLRQNLDEAFARRLAFSINFPFPDPASRALIWRRIWPPEVPLAESVDLDFLAAKFKLSGGNIKNIALAAAFLAAASDGVVKMSHLLHATRREYQKLGRALTAADLAPYALEDEL